MTRSGPSSVVAVAGQYLVYSPGTPPLGDPDDAPLTQTFGMYLSKIREHPEADAWFTIIAQHMQGRRWVRLRLTPALHTLGEFPENAHRYRLGGSAVQLHDDGSFGAAFDFNAELSIDDRAPREILGVIELSER